MKNDNVNELMRLKNSIEKTKAEKNRIEGELRQLSKAMIDEFGTDKPKDIQTKIDGLQKQAETLRAQIEKGLEGLRKELSDAA